MAPEGEDIVMEEVKVEALKLTDAEQAALDAEKAAAEVSSFSLLFSLAP